MRVEIWMSPALIFGSAFNSVSHSIPIDKLSSSLLDRWTTFWVETDLNYQAQRMVVNGSKSHWQKSNRDFPRSFPWVRCCWVSLYMILTMGVNSQSPSVWLTLKWQDRQMRWKEESACREIATGWIIASIRVAWGITEKHKLCTPKTEQSQAAAQAGIWHSGVLSHNSLIWFDLPSEKEKWLPYFCIATLTYLISFPSHHSCRLSHTVEDRRKYQSSSGDLRDPEPVTLYKMEAFHVCCCAVLFPEMSSPVHWCSVTRPSVTQA